MNVTEVVMIVVGVFTVLGSVVSVVWVISKRASYDYVDETFMRKDLHSQEYKTLLEKFEELKKSIDNWKRES